MTNLPDPVIKPEDLPKGNEDVPPLQNSEETEKNISREFLESLSKRERNTFPLLGVGQEIKGELNDEVLDFLFANGNPGPVLSADVLDVVLVLQKSYIRNVAIKSGIKKLKNVLTTLKNRYAGRRGSYNRNDMLVKRKAENSLACLYEGKFPDEKEQPNLLSCEQVLKLSSCGQDIPVFSTFIDKNVIRIEETINVFDDVGSLQKKESEVNWQNTNVAKNSNSRAKVSKIPVMVKATEANPALVGVQQQNHMNINITDLRDAPARNATQTVDGSWLPNMQAPPASIPPARPSKRGGVRWNKVEDEKLRLSIVDYGVKHWKNDGKGSEDGSKATTLKDAEAIAFEGMKNIREMGKRCGAIKWSIIAQHLPGRSGKQCRERWMNHLDPTLSKGKFTEAEDTIIISEQRLRGNRWSEIVKALPGRSENAIKNRWNAIVRKHNNDHQNKQKTKAQALPNPRSSKFINKYVPPPQFSSFKPMQGFNPMAPQNFNALTQPPNFSNLAAQNFNTQNFNPQSFNAALSQNYAAMNQNYNLLNASLVQQQALALKNINAANTQNAQTHWGGTGMHYYPKAAEKVNKKRKVAGSATAALSDSQKRSLLLIHGAENNNAAAGGTSVLMPRGVRGNLQS